MLRAKPPTYMVPHRVTVLDSMPLNDGGKIDRGALSSRPVAKGTRQVRKREVSSDVERKLQQIWGQVLNIDAATISADDSFFRLGGDSVTAVQVSATARAHNLNIATADVVQDAVLHELAAAVAMTDPMVTQTRTRDLKVAGVHMEPDDGEAFPLSPVQNLNMYLEPGPTGCFGQSFMPKLRDRVAFPALARALEDVVSAHPMLRARFSRGDGGQWQQRVSDDVFGSFHLCKEAGMAGGKDKQGEASSIRRCRERFNLETGPMLACVMFDGDEFQSVLIAAHHLVVDLENLASITPEEEHVDGLSVPYRGVNPEASTRGAEKSTTFPLSESHTDTLLGACNDVLDTRPIEVLIAALVHSLAAVFSSSLIVHLLPSSTRVTAASHGTINSTPLVPWDGWFTTIWPAAKVHAVATNLPDTIRLAKDHMRSQPKNGWSYFGSRFTDAPKVPVNAAMFPVIRLWTPVIPGIYTVLQAISLFALE
ncbi:non-ribosomal peptide synthetase [Metarhizium album ARSEF 1941]|uniref:Non-ribosomal peptide synthetase n=1 Tax=Metarhizium album (strain ARSEF 1941) TaxID=1081103 RepID=A0A0B2WN59_METAS|nr:non-ribosomal peptide synthetase [Metarhizium album ARSEF 1941]KHN95109.1 non-ribosomal peptide synthetase [Metarhizium album ARSEF 1941]